MRDWLNNNPTVATIIAVALLAVILIFTIMKLTGGGSNPEHVKPEQVWYFNLTNMSVQAVDLPDDAELPTPLTPGSQDYRLYVYVCDQADCEGLENWDYTDVPNHIFVYLERKVAGAEGDVSRGESQHYIFDFGVRDRWYEDTSESLGLISNRLTTLCGDGVTPMLCHPGS